MIMIEFKFHIAAVGNALRVLQRLGQIGKQRAHLLLGLDVELLRLKAHPIRVVHGLTHLDAHQNVLNIAVLPG